MLNTAATTHMTINLDVIGWIGKANISLLTPHQAIQVVTTARIATNYLMPAKQPKITALCDRGQTGIWFRRDLIVIDNGRTRAAYNQINLADLKPCEFDIERKLRRRQIRKLARQNVEIPTRVHGDLVVGKHQCALLSIRQVQDPDRRYMYNSQGLRGC